MKELLKNKKFRYLLIAFLFVLVFEIMSFLNIRLDDIVEIPLFILISVITGYKTIINGIKNLIKLNFRSINTLMFIAVCGAFYLGQYPEAAIVIILFTLSEYMERFGIQKSKFAIQSLVDNSPKKAAIKNQPESVPVENVKIGDIIIVKPGDKIPLDGNVIEGSSFVDESMITGEPIPEDKRKGDSVFAGTLNKQGYIEMEVTKLSKDSTLSKIIEITFNATKAKAETQKFIEKFSSYYTPSIIIITVLVLLIPTLFFNGNFNQWLLMSLTLLVISCPCALVISTPVAIYSAIGNSSSKGILIKGGKYLEIIGKIKAIAFDKTRTITAGKPIVSDIIPLNGFSEKDLIACAAGLEAFSEHPIAESILLKAKEENIEHHIVKNFESVIGKGVKGDCIVCSDSRHFLGSLIFISEETNLKSEVISIIEKLHEQGKTTLILSTDKNVEGVIGVTDEIKSESVSAINDVKSLGIIPVMLTGDNEKAANFIASLVGIEVVKSHLLPDEKVNEINKLVTEYNYVAMIGDGINDAPALANATIGIAMGTAGSDATIETADICLMNNNLGLVPFLVKLGRKTVSVIKFNTAFAILAKLIFIVLAVLGLSSLVMAIFADVGVTIIVILISLRLTNYE